MVASPYIFCYSTRCKSEKTLCGGATLYRLKKSTENEIGRIAWTNQVREGAKLLT